MNNYMMTAEDIAEEVGVSKGKAYQLIRKMNEERSEKGYIIISGKIPRAYWEEKFFGHQKSVVLPESVWGGEENAGI